MKDLREEINDILLDGILSPRTRMVDSVMADKLLKLFHSWVDGILVELRCIRAGAPLTCDKGRTRGRLKKLIEEIEEVGK